MCIPAELPRLELQLGLGRDEEVQGERQMVGGSRTERGLGVRCVLYNFDRGV